MHTLAKNHLFPAIVIFFFVVACTKPPCEKSGGVQLNANFYRNANNTVKDTLVDSVSLVLGVNLDTVVYEANTTKTQSLSFPLSMNSDTSRVVIVFDQQVSDTLTFVVKRDLTMVSHECGFVYYFNIDEVQTTNNKIKSVWVSKELVEYGTKENIKIYL